MGSKTVRIGAGLGFYGDSFLPALDVIQNGRIEYLCCEHLAELTLAILKKDQLKNPELGFARDLIPMLKLLWPEAQKRGVRIVSNAGGLNPKAAAMAAKRLAEELGLRVKIALIEGDDLLGSLAEFFPLKHLQTQEPLPEDIKDRLVFANAYLGAAPIAQALKEGADLVLTGRVADCSLFLAPCLHELGWGLDDLERLAQGTLAGHLLECSAQVTGGNHGGDWEGIEGLENIGYPIAEVGDGSVLITKTPASGGRVSFDTVREQLLYEMHDPSSYLTPDLILDITQVRLKEVQKNSVLVTGAKGRPRPDSYKAVMGYQDGFMGQAILGYSWPEALKKAKKASEILTYKIKTLGLPIEEVHTSFLGFNSFFEELADTEAAKELNEVYLRLAVRTQSLKAAQALSRLAVPLALQGPPTASGFIGFERTRELIGLWPTSVDRGAVDRHVCIKSLGGDEGAS